jgi:hypothetical protein
MGAITFDTLKFANRLKSAGVPAAQAEAEAEALADVMEIAGRDLVTKEYLDTRLIQLEQRMIIKLGGLMVVAVGIVATLVKIL